MATLREMGFASYAEYIASPRWHARRARFYNAHPRQCFVCEATGAVFLHHRFYGNLGDEPDCDLVPLCGRCHGLLHETHAGLNKIVRRMRKAFLSAGELGLKPSVVRSRKITVLDASRLSDEQRGRFALARPE